MKKIFKSKIFWLVVIIALIGAGFGYQQWRKNQNQVEYVTEKVKLGKLIQTISATGAVEASKDISLNFTLTGRLAYLPVKEGQLVKAGLVLAKLNAGSLSAQIQQYQANLLAAQADLDEVKAGASAEDIKVAEEKAIKVENDSKSLEIESANQLQILREKNLDTLNNAVSTAQVALDKVYSNLLNDDTAINLYFNNANLKNQVEDSYEAIMAKLPGVKEAVQKANQEKTTESILANSDKVRGFLTELNTFLIDGFNLAQSIIVNAAYTQTDKDTIKSDIATQQSTNNTSLTSLQTAKANLLNNYNSYNSQLQAARDNAAIYRADLALKKIGARDFEIRNAEAKVAQARAQLSKVLADLNDYQITAPIDGTITKINYLLGEQTNLAEPVIKMLSTGKFEIKVDIPESDITKIKVGNQAIIELDAFGSDQPFNGAVSFIDPAQTVIQDVTYYQTTVSFDQDSWDEKIKSGMTADITIMAAEKDDVLYIPQRAVKIKEAVLGEKAEKYVEILVNNQPQEKIVETGLRGDNGLVEIINGLIENEEVIVFKKNGIK